MTIFTVGHLDDPVCSVPYISVCVTVMPGGHSGLVSVGAAADQAGVRTIVGDTGMAARRRIG